MAGIGDRVGDLVVAASDVTIMTVPGSADWR